MERKRHYRNTSGRIILSARSVGMKTQPHTPNPELLDPRRELALCLKAFIQTYDKIAKLVHRMTSLKVYSCDEYEIYSGANRFLFDWLEWDKLSLFLYSADLEVKRMDILHWVAIREGIPLPAEVIAIVQRMILDWKQEVHLSPLERVEDKHGLRTLIASSGLAIPADEGDAMSDQLDSQLSFTPVTEVAQCIPIDYSLAIQYTLAGEVDDGRFKATEPIPVSLDVDITQDLNPKPLVDISVGLFDDITTESPDRGVEDFAHGLDQESPGGCKSSTRKPGLVQVPQAARQSHASSPVGPKKQQPPKNGLENSEQTERKRRQTI